MEKLFRFFGKEYGNINQAALLLGSFALVSQVLGLLRDRSFAHFIGPSPTLDAYYAAFRVPDFIFISIASLASITVLIPYLSAKMADGQVTDEARKFLSDVFTAFFFLIVLVSLVAFFLMPDLSQLIAPGFSPAMQAEVTALSRIMLLSPILMGLSSLFGTVTQLFRKFFIYSLSPVLYNLGIIIGIIVFYPHLGIYGLGAGVALGALLHFGVQALASSQAGFRPKFSLSINFSEMKHAALISVPRTLGLAANSMSLIFITALASLLTVGSISIFNFSYNLQSVPLNIIGISYAVAAFPTLVRSVTAGKLAEFKGHLRGAARSIVFWSLPATFLFIVLRAQVVRVILGSKTFSWESTRLVAAAVAIFAVSVLAQGMIALLSRAYYAKGETRRPLKINLLSSVLIVIFAFLFVYIFEHVSFFRYFFESLLKVEGIPGTEVLMLPLAYAAGTIINFILQLIYARRDFMDGEPFIAKTFFQSLGASFFIGLAAYFGLNILGPIFGTTTFLGIFLQGLISGIFGIAVGVLVLYLLKNQELRDLAKTLHTKFWRVKVVAPPQEGL
ncbi:MAG: lipid II flippase MurJ [Patescibacteria group bacterium]